MHARTPGERRVPQGNDQSGSCCGTSGVRNATARYWIGEHGQGNCGVIWGRRRYRWIDRPYHTILSCAPAMYDELWTGGKCMYKLEPVLAEGGELIIYAPHISEISVTHGKLIEEVGYHCRDYFLKQWDRFKDYPWGVLAHSTHVRGQGRFEGGVEIPRARVTLATKISTETCRKINLGYRDLRASASRKVSVESRTRASRVRVASRCSCPK